MAHHTNTEVEYDRETARRAYEDEMVRRYLAGLYLSREDKREARRLIKARNAEAA